MVNAINKSTYPRRHCEHLPTGRQEMKQPREIATPACPAFAVALQRGGTSLFPVHHAVQGFAPPMTTFF